MIQVTILLEPSVAHFYNKIAELSGHALEKVLSDTLYKLAGELSMEALYKKHQEDR